MKPTVFIAGLGLLTLLSGCALFTIGGHSASTIQIERSQQSGAGVVHLWKAELDSSNYVGMTELMRHKTGRTLLAIERHELADELQRWQRIIGGKPITSTTVDTISTTTQTVRTKVDYIRTVTFETMLDGTLWYITSIR